ncbi:hypothetical protein NECAME_11209 [Necator americanus]|uniref:MARVEL domain-containing protein n=1 Tax=Necator americanus TaxID=51031 RepID=W2T7T9_NECAM|nr:hypothetical protein NECAME_11209 [Necator americanus]ETN77231.1 hypothetical protein NECAME_11209 [Necator americanus]
MQLESSIYFYLVVRILCVVNCLVMLFCVALSSGWTSRLAAIIGLMFNLVSLLFVGGAIGTLFVWKLDEMSLPKRSLFMLVFMLTSIITGTLFFVAPGTCDSFNRYGCFQTYYNGTYKIAGAFAFVSVVFALVDMALNFIFYFRSYGVAPVQSSFPAQQDEPRIVSPTPSILKRTEVSTISNEEYDCSKYWF